MGLSRLKPVSLGIYSLNAYIMSETTLQMAVSVVFLWDTL
jgi:hypothetical protein